MSGIKVLKVFNRVVEQVIVEVIVLVVIKEKCLCGIGGQVEFIFCCFFFEGGNFFVVIILIDVEFIVLQAGSFIVGVVEVNV